MKLTAGNMANIDTPGYKTQGFDFEQEFSRALKADDSQKTTPQVVNTEGLVSRPDGNNVSLDREAMQLAKTQLQFRMGVALLKGENDSMMKAIHLEDK
jgi:flagellar basal-body rod protein FlgB